MTDTLPTPAALAVIALSATSWRVSDPSRRPDNGLSVIGFVHCIGDVFEVTVLGLPREREYCGSFNKALQYLARASGKNWSISAPVGNSRLLGRTI
jgi:hypothetical protein